MDLIFKNILLKVVRIRMIIGGIRTVQIVKIILSDDVLIINIWLISEPMVLTVKHPKVTIMSFFVFISSISNWLSFIHYRLNLMILSISSSRFIFIVFAMTIIANESCG